MYPSLPKSYKGLYPFKIGTTSFIYPAGYAQNVKMLGPYVDEIELLLFEGAPDSLPSTQEIKNSCRCQRNLILPIMCTCPPTYP